MVTRSIAKGYATLVTVSMAKKYCEKTQIVYYFKN